MTDKNKLDTGTDVGKRSIILSSAQSNLDSADSIPKLKNHVIANKYLQDDSIRQQTISEIRSLKKPQTEQLEETHPIG